jgi:hypothetical protein
MIQVSIISDEKYCSIFLKYKNNTVELSGTSNPWITLFKALIKLEIIKIKSQFKKTRKKI